MKKLSGPIKFCLVIGSMFLAVLIGAYIVKRPDAPIWPLLLLTLLVILAFFVMPFVFRAKEKKEYNGGFCPKCGHLLEHFDTDSGGNQGYCCSHCHEYYIWIGWYDPR